MSFENILFEIREPLAIVTLHRPKVLNALNQATFSELERAFTELAASESVRAILLTGAGERAFAAGADMQIGDDFGDRGPEACRSRSAHS